MDTALKERIIKSRVKLLRSSPFFGVLLLNSVFSETDLLPTAATDGKSIMINPEFAKNLKESEFNGVVLHEVLHMALEHVMRMKDVFEVDPVTANFACDIVVNGIIDDNAVDYQTGSRVFELPGKPVRDNKLKHLSVREIYNILKQKQAKDENYLQKQYGISEVNTCLQKPESGSGNNKGDQEGGSGNEDDQDQGEGNNPINGNPNDSGVDWKEILNKAATIARMKKAGPTGAAMERIFKELLQPTIDWRTIVYKYLTDSRNDFEGYDRRFVHNGLYIDDFAGSQLHVLIYVDVSGSIDDKLLREFMSEIYAAVNTVSTTVGEVHCFDTRLHYVCDVRDINTQFKLIGGGGTCFRCIFSHIQKYKEENPGTNSTDILPIILTDGYADLDGHPPTNPLLWAISPGGVPSHTFPMGEVVRIGE